MSKLIKEIENDIATLQATLDKAKLLEDKFELCGDGYSVFSYGEVKAPYSKLTKDFAAIFKTEKQAIKRRRILYLQNVEFQLAEHFNEGEECDWSARTIAKYSINFSHEKKKYFLAVNYQEQNFNVSHFISKEAGEKALPYYIEAVKRYDRGGV